MLPALFYITSHSLVIVISKLKAHNSGKDCGTFYNSIILFTTKEEMTELFTISQKQHLHQDS